jgi:diguanylate cyclase (GGDEF)-like protein/PAS domain S-box-containing protein
MTLPAARAILDHISTFVALLDLQGRVVSANQVACGTLGLAASDSLPVLVDLPWARAHRAGPRIVEAIAAATAGRVDRFTLDDVGRSNRRRRTLFSFSPFPNPSLPDGPVEQIVMEGREVADLASAINALRNNDQRLSTMLSQGLDGIFYMLFDSPRPLPTDRLDAAALDVIAQQLHVTEATEAMLAQYGSQRADFVGRSHAELFAHDPAGGRQLLERLLVDGRLRQEAAARRDDGSTFWIESDYLCLYGEADDLLGYFAIQHDISARHNQMEALQQHAQVLEHAPISIIITDPQARIEYINPYFSTITGYDSTEVIGRNPRILKAGDLPHTLYDELWREIGNGRIWRGTLHNRRKNRELYWEEAVIAPVTNEQGAITHFIGIKRDITGEVESRLALEKERSHLRALLDNIPDLIYYKDTQGSYIDCNPAFAQFLESSPEAVRGHRDDDLMPRLQAAFTREQDLAVLTGEAPQHREEWLHSGDGSRLFEMTRAPVRDPLGQVLGLIGVGRDITARRETEDRLRLAASVFESAHDSIMITDPTGRIVEVNDAFVQLTGYSREEALGETPSILRSGHHPAEFFQAMWQAIGQDGYWHGEIWNRRKDGQAFVETLTISTVRDNTGEITNFVAIFSDITALKETQKRLEHLAYHDALTHLPNRVLLGDRMQLALAQARRRQDLLAVCYLDLDNFKPVNDQHGHQAGDRLLVEVAHRLTNSLRDCDTIARLGGDEFALLITDLGSPQEISQTLSRLMTNLCAPYRVANSVDVAISATIGYTLFPGDNADPDTLLRHADQAMYQAKTAGRNRFYLFDTSEHQRRQAHRESRERIALAIERDELELHYQPRVNMRLGSVLGVEALVRWRHPEKGLLMPAEFLPLIEGSEVIASLGDWVLRTALRQVEVWKELGYQLLVSVNIAAHHLLMPNFSERLVELLAQHPGVSPRQLELEILETTALEDMLLVSRIIDYCQGIGISFALDDFGTGYSSLTYFKRLPANTLKIDQSFVRDMLEDPEDLAIVEGILGLTAAFKRKVIAEGVETIEHGILLLHLGCDEGQGYGIARPMPAAKVLAWIDAFRPDPSWTTCTTLRWRREDFPLIALEVDHRRWINHLQETVLNGSNVLAEKAEQLANPHVCRFGNWLRTIGQNHYGHLAELGELDALHQRVHRLGGQAIGELNGGHIDRAVALTSELASVGEQLVDKLHTLQILVSMEKN